MKKIGIIGYGAFGRQIESFLVEEQGKGALEVFYFDDQFHNAGGENAYPFNAFLDSRFRHLSFYIGLGYKHLAVRKKICDQLLNEGLQLPSFVHRTTYVNPTAKVGYGVYIYPMCNIDQEVELEVGTMLNNSVIISHNGLVDACTFIAPGVTIAGNVRIGKYCFIGAGSVIANTVTIADNAKVGLGSTITRNVGENACVIGNPMKILEKPFQLI
jgi:sugar O-acyltransferase (sialic acid O-acetyltransferase NeuD family)